jgi:hypothetical protein
MKDAAGCQYLLDCRRSYSTSVYGSVNSRVLFRSRGRVGFLARLPSTVGTACLDLFLAGVALVHRALGLELVGRDRQALDLLEGLQMERLASLHRVLQLGHISR